MNVKYVIKFNCITENDLLWDNETDRDEWEEAQNRLDRQWYNLDEGVDETNNPFSDVSESYAKKKEQQLAQSKKKRMSAQQRQINKVCILYIYQPIIISLSILVNYLF